jgi:long-chain acyl-CoA synthetase
MNLATLFSESVQRHPQKVAIYFGDKEISYADISARAQAVAAHLKNQLGVKPGDRVALWLKNCPEFIMSVYGILFADAVVVPMNNFLKPAEAAYILNDGGIDVLITDAELGAHFPELSAARPSLKMLKVEEFASLPAGAGDNSSRTAKDLAVII